MRAAHGETANASCVGTLSISGPPRCDFLIRKQSDRVPIFRHRKGFSPIPTMWNRRASSCGLTRSMGGWPSGFQHATFCTHGLASTRIRNAVSPSSRRFSEHLIVMRSGLIPSCTHANFKPRSCSGERFRALRSRSKPQLTRTETLRQVAIGRNALSQVPS